MTLKNNYRLLKYYQEAHGNPKDPMNYIPAQPKRAKEMELHIADRISKIKAYMHDPKHPHHKYLAEFEEKPKTQVKKDAKKSKG